MSPVPEITLLLVLIPPAGLKLCQQGGQILFLWEGMGYYFHLIYLVAADPHADVLTSRRSLEEHHQHCMEGG
jgi:hypothetical protein